MIWLICHRMPKHNGMLTYLKNLQLMDPQNITIISAKSALVKRPKPNDLVIFSDYVGEDGVRLIQQWTNDLYPSIKYSLLIFSPLLQADISNEIDEILGRLIRENRESAHIKTFYFVDKDFANFIQAVLPEINAVWLPAVAHPLNNIIKPIKRFTDSNRIWMPLTLPDNHPNYRHKNVLCQLAAIGKASKQTGIQTAVFTNYTSDIYLKFAKFSTIENLSAIGSISQSKYNDFLETIKLGLCVSLSESFSFNCLELMCLGIPTLFGPAIAWAWSNKELVEVCGIENPGSIGMLAHKISRIFSDQDLYQEASRLGVVASNEVINNHIAYVKHILDLL